MQRMSYLQPPMLLPLRVVNCASIFASLVPMETHKTFTPGCPPSLPLIGARAHSLCLM